MQSGTYKKNFRADNLLPKAEKLCSGSTGEVDLHFDRFEKPLNKSWIVRFWSVILRYELVKRRGRIVVVLKSAV